MNKADWVPYKVTGKLTKVRSKNVNAILITHENVSELQKEFPFITMLGKALLVGAMSFMALPVYLVNINPRQPLDKRYYMFIMQDDFEKNAEKVDDNK